MRDDKNYLKIINYFLPESIKKTKIKYSYLVRSSLKEIEELNTRFHLSEICDALQKDSGIKINYNSFWQAYNRFKKSTSNNIHIITDLPDTQKEPLIESEAIIIIDQSENYQWLDNIDMHIKLKEMIIDQNMTESDFLAAKINIRSPLIAMRQITEYMVEKNLAEHSKKYFEII